MAGRKPARSKSSLDAALDLPCFVLKPGGQTCFCVHRHSFSIRYVGWVEIFQTRGCKRFHISYVSHKTTIFQ